MKYIDPKTATNVDLKDIRIVKNEVLVNSPIKQYMLLGDKEGIKELKDQENLPVIKRDHYI